MSRTIECPVCREIVAVRSDASSCGSSKCRMSVYRMRKKGMDVKPKEVERVLSTNRYYLLRAAYDWLVDNKLKPVILVDATTDGTQVPQQYVKDGFIVLDICREAVADLQISSEFMTFSATFGGANSKVSLPIGSIVAIYDRGTASGTVLDLEESYESSLKSSIEALCEIRGSQSDDNISHH